MKCVSSVTLSPPSKSRLRGRRHPATVFHSVRSIFFCAPKPPFCHFHFAFMQGHGEHSCKNASITEYPGHALRRFERSEEHTSELQSLMRISYAVFCLKTKPPPTHPPQPPPTP